MLLIFSTGVALWVYYGLMLHSWIIILTNVVTLGLTTAILALKLLCRA
jgi:MtN3 and saliva related transmembrane protein